MAAKSGKKGGSSVARALEEGEMWVDPATVRFTHARIRPFFSGCNRAVQDTLDDIVAGRLRAEDLPLITIMSGAAEGGPPYFSLNNRRLWVLKQLRDRGLLENNVARVMVRPAANTRRLRDKYTVDKCSLTAKFIREKSAISGDGKQKQTVVNDDDGDSDGGDDDDDDDKGGPGKKEQQAQEDDDKREPDSRPKSGQRGNRPRPAQASVVVPASASTAAAAAAAAAATPDSKPSRRAKAKRRARQGGDNDDADADADGGGDRKGGRRHGRQAGPELLVPDKKNNDDDNDDDDENDD